MGHISEQGETSVARLATYKKALALRGTPALGSQDGAKEHKIHVKFFSPDSSWTWFVTEWDGKDECWGYVVGMEKEWGTIDLQELADATGPLGLMPEVDILFLPQTLEKLSLLDAYAHRL